MNIDEMSEGRETSLYLKRRYWLKRCWPVVVWLIGALAYLAEGRLLEIRISIGKVVPGYWAERLADVVIKYGLVMRRDRRAM